MNKLKEHIGELSLKDAQLFKYIVTSGIHCINVDQTIKDKEALLEVVEDLIDLTKKRIKTLMDEETENTNQSK